jgi:hypothetical protein
MPLAVQAVEEEDLQQQEAAAAAAAEGDRIAPATTMATLLLLPG